MAAKARTYASFSEHASRSCRRLRIVGDQVMWTEILTGKLAF